MFAGNQPDEIFHETDRTYKYIRFIKKNVRVDAVKVASRFRVAYLKEIQILKKKIGKKISSIFFVQI